MIISFKFKTDNFIGIQDVNLAEQSTEEDKDIGDKGNHEGDRSEEQFLEADTCAVRGKHCLFLIENCSNLLLVK